MADAALDITPNAFGALEAKELLLLKLDQADRALACFDIAAQKGRLPYHRRWGWTYKGAALRRLGRIVEALAAFDEALALGAQPEGSTLVGRANCLRDLRRFDEALESPDDALRIWSGDAVAWFNRALALEDVGRVDDAIESYRRCLATSTAHDPIYQKALDRLDDAERLRRRVRRLGTFERLGFCPAGGYRQR